MFESPKLKKRDSAKQNYYARKDLDISGSPVDSKATYNPFDSSIDNDRIVLRKVRSPKVTYSRKDIMCEPARHSYPTNAFIRKTRDLRCFILEETERLISRDGRSLLCAHSRQELAAGVAPNCSIRKRMFKLGLL